MAIEESKQLEGRGVRSADGKYLGKVSRTTPGHIVVEQGFFFPEDFEIPLEEIASSAVDMLQLRHPAKVYFGQFQGAPAEEPGPQKAYPFTEADLTEGGPAFDAHGRPVYPGIGYPVSAPREDVPTKLEPNDDPSPPGNDGRQP